MFLLFLGSESIKYVIFCMDSTAGSFDDSQLQASWFNSKLRLRFLYMFSTCLYGFLLRSLVLTPLSFRKRISYAKLPVGVIVCALDNPPWIGVPLWVYSPLLPRAPGYRKKQ